MQRWPLLISLLAKIVQWTNVQGDSCPREFLSNDRGVQEDYCPRWHLSKENLTSSLGHMLLHSMKFSTIYFNTFLSKTWTWDRSILVCCTRVHRRSKILNKYLQINKHLWPTCCACNRIAVIADNKLYAQIKEEH